MERYLKAREFAIKAHGDQKYGEGEPYVVHLDDVANVLREFGYDEDLYLTLAYLHDVLEDTEVTADGIKEIFDDLHVIEGTLFLTDMPGPNRKTRKQQTYAHCQQVIRATFEDTSVFLKVGVSAAVRVKLADRIANLRRSVGTPLMKMYRKEREAFRSAYYCAKPGDAMWAEYDRLVETPMPVKMTVELSDGSRRFLSGEKLTQWLSDSGAAIIFAQEHGCVTKPWTIQDWEKQGEGMKPSDLKVMQSIAGTRQGDALIGYLASVADRAGAAKSEIWEYIKDTPENRDLIVRANSFNADMDPASEDAQIEFLVTGPVQRDGIRISIGALAIYFKHVLEEEAKA